MEFKITAHAEKRMKQRNIAHPDDVVLVIAKNKYRKKIKNRCLTHGYKKEFIYWRRKEEVAGFISVYVCRQLDINTYLVVTAFNLKAY